MIINKSKIEELKRGDGVQQPRAAPNTGTNNAPVLCVWYGAFVQKPPKGVSRQWGGRASFFWSYGHGSLLEAAVGSGDGSLWDGSRAIVKDKLTRI